MKLNSTQYNPYGFMWRVDQYDETFGTITFTAGQERHTVVFEYAMAVKALYPPLYIQDPKNNVRDYIDYMYLDIYKKKNEQEYVVGYKISSISNLHQYPSAEIILPVANTSVSKEVIENIFASTAFDYKKAPFNIHAKAYQLGAFSMEELSEPQNFSSFKFAVAVVNMALKKAGLPEMQLDENDLRIKLNFRRKWLSWDTWSRWLRST